LISKSSRVDAISLPVIGNVNNGKGMNRGGGSAIRNKISFFFFNTQVAGDSLDFHSSHSWPSFPTPCGRGAADSRVSYSSSLSSFHCTCQNIWYNKQSQNTQTKVNSRLTHVHLPHRHLLFFSSPQIAFYIYDDDDDNIHYLYKNSISKIEISPHPLIVFFNIYICKIAFHVKKKWNQF